VLTQSALVVLCVLPPRPSSLVGVGCWARLALAPSAPFVLCVLSPLPLSSAWRRLLGSLDAVALSARRTLCAAAAAVADGLVSVIGLAWCWRPRRSPCSRVPPPLLLSSARRRLLGSLDAVALSARRAFARCRHRHCRRRGVGCWARWMLSPRRPPCSRLPSPPPLSSG
jgi:hypothetical protein